MLLLLHCVAMASLASLAAPQAEATEAEATEEVAVTNSAEAFAPDICDAPVFLRKGFQKRKAWGTVSRQASHTAHVVSHDRAERDLPARQHAVPSYRACVARVPQRAVQVEDDRVVVSFRPCHASRATRSKHPA